MPGIDADTKLMLHCNGTDGSPDFPDESDSDHTVTAVATAQVDTAFKKFETGSLLLDGNSDILTIPDSTAWDLGVTELTIDLHLKFSSYSGIQVLMTQRVDNDNRWFFEHYSGGFGFYSATGGVVKVSIPYNGTITDTNWHHLALIRIGGRYWGIYVDGTQVSYYDDGLATLGEFTSGLSIGNNGNSGQWFNGNMDEIRIQQSNYFNASPNVGLSDTIIVPTEAYTALTRIPTSQSIIII